MPTIEELLSMTEGVTEKQNALDKLAQTQVTGRAFREPGQSKFGGVFGKGTPEQTRAMIAMLSNPKKQGQSGIQALGEGFEKGMALRDQLTEKQGNRKVAAAKLGVKGAQDALKNQADIYGLETAADKTAYSRERDAYGIKKDEEREIYDRARDKVKDSQWATEQENAKETRVFASQVKEQAAVSTELYKSEKNASQADMLAADMGQYAATAQGGLAAQLGTLFKDNAGLRDQVSSLRTRANSLINTNVINNLPPGIASDKDIEIAMRGFPNPEKATLKELQDFAKALANIERGNAMYQREKLAYMDANNYSILGFQKVWDAKRKEMLDRNAQGNSNVPAGAPRVGAPSGAGSPGTPAFQPGGAYTYDPATGGFK